MYVNNVVRCSVIRLCSQHRRAHNLKFQLELGEFAPGLEPLEFVSGVCSSIRKHGLKLHAYADDPHLYQTSQSGHSWHRGSKV